MKVGREMMRLKFSTSQRMWVAGSSWLVLLLHLPRSTLQGAAGASSEARVEGREADAVIMKKAHQNSSYGSSTAAVLGLGSSAASGNGFEQQTPSHNPGRRQLQSTGASGSWDSELEPQPPPPPPPVTARLTLDMDIATIPVGSDARTDFEAAFKVWDFSNTWALQDGNFGRGSLHSPKLDPKGAAACAERRTSRRRSTSAGSMAAGSQSSASRPARSSSSSS